MYNETHSSDGKVKSHHGLGKCIMKHAVVMVKLNHTMVWENANNVQSSSSQGQSIFSINRFAFQERTRRRETEKVLYAAVVSTIKGIMHLL